MSQQSQHIKLDRPLNLMSGTFIDKLWSNKTLPISYIVYYPLYSYWEKREKNVANL